MKIKISALERSALLDIFSRENISNHLSLDIIDGLVIERREFSEVYGRPDCCSGFYSYFEYNEFLAGINGFSTGIGAQCSYPGLDIGVLFTLFTKPGLSINFLEGAFYGEVLKISDVLSDTSDVVFWK